MAFNILQIVKKVTLSQKEEALQKKLKLKSNNQKSLKDAIAMCDAIYAITVENVDVKEALKIYHSNHRAME
jgi:hypothetical protein